MMRDLNRLEPIMMHTMKMAKMRPWGMVVLVPGSVISRAGVHSNTKMNMADSKLLCAMPSSATFSSAA